MFYKQSVGGDCTTSLVPHGEDSARGKDWYAWLRPRNCGVKLWIESGITVVSMHAGQFISGYQNKLP